MDDYRIQIIGGPGNGKSTLAMKLGNHLKIPVYHIDDLFWQPGWEMLPKPVLKDHVIEIADQSSSWIFDGNYSSVRPSLVDRATHIIFIRLPFYRVLWQLILRETIRRLPKPILPVSRPPKNVIHDRVPENLIQSYYEFFKGAYRHYSFRTMEIYQEVKSQRKDIATFVMTDHTQLDDLLDFLKRR